MADKKIAVERTCSACSQELLDGLLFCTSCGAATALGQKEYNDTNASCLSCGAVDALSKSFCVSCGTQIDTAEARAKSQMLSKRSGLDWRSSAMMAARKPDLPQIAATQVTRHPETVAIPAALGILCGALISAAGIMWGEGSLNYALARAASPKHGLVLFVRVLNKDGMGSGFLDKQPPVRVSLLPIDGSSGNGGAQKGSSLPGGADGKNAPDDGTKGANSGANNGSPDDAKAKSTSGDTAKANGSTAAKTDGSAKTDASTAAGSSAKTAPSAKANGPKTAAASRDAHDAPPAVQELKAETDEFGMLTMPNLPGGRYKISLTAEGCGTAAATITVKDDTETIVGWPRRIELIPSDDTDKSNSQSYPK